MEFSRKINFIVVLFLMLFFSAVVYFTLKVNKNTVSTALVSETSNEQHIDQTESKPLKDLPKPLPNPPSVIRSVYVTSGSAAGKNYLLYLDHLFKTTEVNAVVIDIKDFSGIVSYKTGAIKVKEYKNFRQVFNIDNLVEHFHSRNIYVIARINVFNDVALAKARPDLAVYSKSKSPARSTTAVTGGENQPENVLWKDNSGLYWLDPASEEVWDYNIEIAKDVLLHGFDEVNFDYIRFPSDGEVEDIGYPIKDEAIIRRSVIKSFFQKIRKSMPDAKLSVDLFGQTTVITVGDMGVGQVFEDAFDYFDYVCPMVYPSHYVNGFLGYENPAEYPYEVVKNALDNAILRKSVYQKENPENPSQPVDQLANGVRARKLARIRPWIQDFDLGADYDSEKVGAEIKATKDALKEDFNGFMLWNPSNFYTTEALASGNYVPN